jgi:ABC-2 type transport system ATP-binding protein
VRTVLTDLRERGISVLLSSHLLSEVELVCDRVAILYRGKVVAEGAPAQLTGAAGVEVETAGGTRSFPDVARDEIPALVERLIGEGESIFAVRPSRSTLEDFYIEKVSDVDGQ